jgi:glycosyltransferase involved in cell wall biosynthesis
VTETFVPKIDGIVNTLTRVIDHLPSLGWDVRVVAPGPGPTRYGRASVVRVPGMPLPLYPEVRLGLFNPGAIAAVDRFQPDLVHVAGPAFLGVAAALWASRRGLPTVATYHTHLAPYARHYGLGPLECYAWAALRAIHNRCDLTLAPSTTVLRDLQARDVRNLALWGRGVDDQLFHPSRRSGPVRAQLGVQPGDVLVAYVGRVAREKGLDRIHEVLAASPRVRLVIVGDGPYRAALQRELPPDRVVFTGYRTGESLARFYASADMFVFPSETDTFGNVILEAMASGLPVIAANCGGAPDLIDHGVTGLTLDPRDPQAYRDAVARLVDAPARRLAMGRAARQAAEGRSWLQIARQLTGHYEGVLTAVPR